MGDLVVWLSHQPEWLSLPLATLLGVTFLAAVFAVWAVGYMALSTSRTETTKAPAASEPPRGGLERDSRDGFEQL